MQAAFSSVVRELAGWSSNLLVLAFAATSRHLALRAARIDEQAVRHVEFRFIRIGQTIVYRIIAHDSIESKWKLT